MNVGCLIIIFPKFLKSFLFFLGGGRHSNSKFLEPYGWDHDMYLIDSPWFCWVFDGFWMDLVGFLIDRVWILHGLGLDSDRTAHVRPVRTKVWVLWFGFLKLFLESVWILYHALWTRSEHEFFGNTKFKLGQFTCSIGEKTSVGKKFPLLLCWEKSFYYCQDITIG